MGAIPIMGFGWHPTAKTMKRCAGCGFPWDMPSDECLNCGRPADMNRVEWKKEWGEPKNNF